MQQCDEFQLHMLSEISQTQRSGICVIPFIWQSGNAKLQGWWTDQLLSVVISREWDPPQERGTVEFFEKWNCSVWLHDSMHLPKLRTRQRIVWVHTLYIKKFSKYFKKLLCFLYPKNNLTVMIPLSYMRILSRMFVFISHCFYSYKLITVFSVLYTQSPFLMIYQNVKNVFFLLTSYCLLQLLFFWNAFLK